MRGHTYIYADVHRRLIRTMYLHTNVRPCMYAHTTHRKRARANLQIYARPCGQQLLTRAFMIRKRGAQTFTTDYLRAYVLLPCKNQCVLSPQSRAWTAHASPQDRELWSTSSSAFLILLASCFAAAGVGYRNGSSMYWPALSIQISNSQRLSWVLTPEPHTPWAARA